jgi:hypothetical protein
MEPLASEPPHLVQVMIPRWVYNRIVTLLVAVQSGAKPEDYIVAVLEAHARRLNLGPARHERQDCWLRGRGERAR